MSSLRQLAQELKLSHATVSDTLRDLPGVKGATRERVLLAAARIGYRANPLATCTNRRWHAGPRAAPRSWASS